MEKVLRDYNISPNQYYFLIAVHEKTIPYKITKDEVEDLKRRSFFIEDSSGIYLNGPIKDVFSKEDVALKVLGEIWKIYPTRTPNGRTLHPSDINSLMGKKVCNKLRKEITKYNNQSQIIKGLKNEIKNRSKLKDGLNYMQRLDTWINQKSWESYQDEEESQEDGNVYDIA